ncbi:polyprenyl synthetase family protein [Vicingaceae bacterium]|nr:polyprenyl synthetase family protein [Vicingaceae bacterium]
MQYSLVKIKAPIQEEMDTFETHFRDSMKSQVALLDKITHYIIKRKGKQMRPMFVFLSAKLFGETNEKSYTAASLIELLHTATLVHDDVVDESYQRRGFFSINALWKNKIAVLVGDYLLSKGLLLSVDNNGFDLLRIVSDSVRKMSEGELLQIEKARRLDIEEHVYFDIITKKTATLIASCCATGAASVGQPKEVVDQMHEFGELTGIAFQIKDDLFDYGNYSDIGKPFGIDIKEKKMTLPLIYALNKTSKSERRRIIQIIKNHSENSEKVQEVIKFVLGSGGIDYATQKMIEYRDRAIEILHTFPDNSARQSLEELVMYTTERVK